MSKQTETQRAAELSQSAPVYVRRLPWEKEGKEGWEHFVNFKKWLTNQFIDCGQYEDNENWVDSCPTFLISVFERFADEVGGVQKCAEEHYENK